MWLLRPWRVGAATAACALLFLTGCGTYPQNPDPYERLNRVMYNVNDGIDKAALKPLSDVYVAIVPKPVRQGLGNAFNNLGYLNVILNDFLQGKVDQGFADAGRMAVNSTVGVAGIFDVATKWNLPEHKNDFGITLGKWGAEPGPYLVLPLFGPATVRDVPGRGVSMVTNPLYWVDVPLAASIPMGVLEAAQTRADLNDLLKFRDEAAIDPYVFVREGYLNYRRRQIQGTKATGPAPGFYDEDEPATQPTTRPATERVTAR